ncbi:hypothetical protein B5724_14285 [Morganella morganii]|uniref:hypothetical protein n=1 Tax=Morganella morganii TaxID=582 RepID=UPI000B3FD433|nr:hypothetical protein [Morganella morganii]OVF52943.1 hypothetical protein B5724_14285 [Morganella morganii]HBC7443492.1 hypothetical protein [Morganella morganii]HED1571095.1 hypothetical protein [Morganella morganii]
MNELTLSNSFGVVTGKVIDTQKLLSMINMARKSCDENQIRNNVLIERVKDELDGEFYKIFVKPSGESGGRPTEVIEMEIKQALRVAARESKAVRRVLVDKLESMHIAAQKGGKSQSGLPEYRQARTLKMSVDAIGNLFDMMPNLSPEAKQCAAANIVNPIVGFEAVPLPVLEQKYYTAGEVGEMLEVSANKIGRIANKHELKTDEFGKFFLDKSAHSAKQVEAFRYNDEGIKALRHIIHGKQVA